MSTGNILAIETATKVCSVAFARDGAILAETTLNVPQVHVERLVISINDLLANLHLGYADIDAVAVSNGPGSFTGLRIGLSVAKGIVFGRDKKLIAVPTLDAIALRAREFAGERRVVSLLHARAKEFYCGTYKVGSSAVEVIGGYEILEAEEIVAGFDASTLFVGEGVVTFSADPGALGKFGSSSMKVIQASAREVAMLADDKFRKDEFSDLRTLAPLYIKDFVAIKGNPLNKLSRKTPSGESAAGARRKSGVEKSR